MCGTVACAKFSTVAFHELFHAKDSGDALQAHQLQTDKTGRDRDARRRRTST